MLNEFIRFVCGESVAAVGIVISTLLFGGIMIVLWLINEIRNGARVDWKKVKRGVWEFSVVVLAVTVLMGIIIGIMAGFGHLAKWIAGCL